MNAETHFVESRYPRHPRPSRASLIAPFFRDLEVHRREVCKLEAMLSQPCAPSNCCRDEGLWVVQSRARNEGTEE